MNSIVAFRPAPEAEPPPDDTEKGERRRKTKHVEMNVRRMKGVETMVDGMEEILYFLVVLVRVRKLSRMGHFDLDSATSGESR